MQLSAYEIALIAGGFGIAGTLLGALISYRFALRIAGVQFNNALCLGNVAARKDAACNLRAAFAPEIAALRVIGDYRNTGTRPKTVEKNYVVNLLSNAYPKHSAAIEEFRHYISVEDAPAYQEAWEKYYQNGFEDYDGYDGTATPFTNFQNRVHAILRFAPL